MSRAIVATALTASQAERVTVVYLVDIAFATPLYFNTSPYAISWNSNSYTAGGNFGGFDSIEESLELSAKGLSIALSGIPASLISVALGGSYQGKAVNIWLAFLNNDTHALIADPVQVGANYRVDTMSVSLGSTAAITLTAESYLADLRRPRVSRYTDAEQKELYRGDKGLEFSPVVFQGNIVAPIPGSGKLHAF